MFIGENFRDNLAKSMVDFRITYTLLMQSQPPFIPPYQGGRDFESFEKGRIIDKCQLISIIHH